LREFDIQPGALIQREAPGPGTRQ